MEKTVTTRLMFKLGAVVLAAGLFGACSSDNPAGGSSAPEQPASGETLAPTDPAVTNGDAGTAAAPDAAADDLCTVIPDLAAIEAAIGEAAKDPLGVGDAGYQQSCTLARAVDDFPGITFTLIPGGTIAAQTEFAKTNFNVDIVPLEGADGFYAGEGTSVYWEGNGNLYQASASLSGDGDARTASLNLLRAWVGA
jgi:hypothetical protein